MHRQCGRCGYGWLELALDTPELTDEDAAKRIYEWQVEYDAAGTRFLDAMLRRIVA